jgi:hypothetical protein
VLGEFEFLFLRELLVTHYGSHFVITAVCFFLYNIDEYLNALYRCVNCNFRVAEFALSSWSESVDYLFFRLNFLNGSEALKLALLDSQDSCAYCCQCSWVNVRNGHDVVSKIYMRYMTSMSLNMKSY